MKNKEKWIIMIPGGNPMKEKKAESEKTIVIDIKLTRGLVVALSCVLVIVGLLAYQGLTGESAVASETETAQAASTGMRQFYLTKDAYLGNLALTACAPGYHMASLWEIADPSNLKYYTRLGYRQADSGQGPPASFLGWVRTGYGSSTAATAGQGNCGAWSSTSGTGSVVYLDAVWTSSQDVGVWSTTTRPCSDPEGHRVWCIED